MNLLPRPQKRRAVSKTGADEPQPVRRSTRSSVRLSQAFDADSFVTPANKVGVSRILQTPSTFDPAKVKTPMTRRIKRGEM
jgi:hypothetical protein